MKRAVLILLLIAVAVPVGAAEYYISWQPVTHYADGRPIPSDIILTYEVHRGDGWMATTADSFLDVETPDDDRTYFILNARIESAPPSPPSPELSGRTVRVLPGYGRVYTSVYPEPLHLLAVKHPHPLDSLRIDDQGVYWWSYLDLNRDKWVNLSDLGLFAVRFVAAHFSPGWGMYRIGGDLGPADLIVMREIMNGPATRTLE